LRIDPLAMAVWLFLTVIKVAILQHLATTTLARILGLRDDRPLAVPLAALVLLMSDGLFTNKQELDAWLLSGWPVYAVCMQLLLPLGLALVAVLRPGLRGQPGQDGPSGQGGRSGRRAQAEDRGQAAKRRRAGETP